MIRKVRPEESWELLEKRAFGNDCCPDELLEVVKEIAENCKGLPLVSDLIFGVIAGREKKKSEWLEVRNNLNSFSLNSEVDVMKVVDLEVMKVIELSYEHLPNHLKPCLLYLARFPKDTTMETDELKMYWHAEGLVELTEMMSVEEVMEVYLDNLISSSLVILFNKRENSNPPVSISTEWLPVHVEQQVDAHNGSDRAEESIARYYSNMARAARIFHPGICPSHPRGI
ncbi:putative WUSCHEL-related homeobox 5-like [Capsicum annuum]|nr:putative WUSCHEL-related homeobox 5-like [Capsicum annuum]